MSTHLMIMIYCMVAKWMNIIRYDREWNYNQRIFSELTNQKARKVFFTTLLKRIYIAVIITNNVFV